jgi:hypothetical protein
METTKNVKVSYNITTPLFLIFLILKLTGVINWSWFWVTSPLWIPLAIMVFVLGFFVLIAFLASKN